MVKSLSDVRAFAALAGMGGKAESLQLMSAMGFKLAYRPATSDVGVLEHSFENDIFLSGVPEYRPAPTDTVLDVGAHLGDFSLLVCGQVARVYSVEARQETSALLKTNIWLNGADNVISDHVALSDKNGFETLYYAAEGESWGDSTTFDHRASGETVQALTLDRYFYERNISRVDFAKFNCEGAEFPILMAASADALGKIGMMLILYHCELVVGQSEAMLCDKLNQSGFVTAVRNREATRGWIIARRREVG